MRIKTLVLLAVSMVFAVALLGCGGAEQTQTPAAEPETTTETADAIKPYPLDYCLVSGEKLGSMGDPVVTTYAGQEIKFCCAGCIPTFEESPAMYIAKLDSAAAGMGDHDGQDEDADGHEGHGHS